VVLLAVSGVPGLWLARQAARGQGVANGLVILGAASGIIGTCLSLISPATPTLVYLWSLPLGQFAVAIDGLSAVFLLPVFLITGLSSIYGLAYWRQSAHPDTGVKLRLCFGFMAAALAMVVVARDAILFLMAWEVMALAAFFLITTEDNDDSVRHSGWLYLVATHVATLALLAMFALWQEATGSLALVPVTHTSASSGKWTAIFLLTLLGFGVKAGLMPLHVWLPGAHANGPSHVSALMSGVLIKMGIYGLVRMTGLFPTPPLFWGGLVLLLGVSSGVLGVVFAIGQHDLKRLLAYHSIENIGIIAMGLGLALLGRSLGRQDWLVLGLAGALLHVWNHGLFKSLLFLSAGAVLHTMQRREIDHMGGLAGRMPYTAGLFLVGAVAICGLPPLNGFVSELLIYLGLFRTLSATAGPSWVGAAFSAPLLAMIGALAVACFVKVFGTVFLGHPRSAAAQQAHEAPAPMLLPMAILAAACFIIGLVPAILVPVLDHAVAAWAPDPLASRPPLAILVPFGWISVAGVLLLGLTGSGFWLLWRRLQQGAFKTVGTWDCGYAAPSIRMQYTASSFAQFLVHLFTWVLRPRIHAPPLAGLFPAAGRFESHIDDTVLHTLVFPLSQRVEHLLARCRVLQQGRIQVYILYIAVGVVVFLVLSI
jgi:hydrogenase-4 component B